MKNSVVTVVVLAFMAVGLFTASAQVPAEKQRHFLSALKKGQPVSLKEVSGRYEISVMEGVAGVQGYKVQEVGADHVVVHDIAGVIEIHVPVYSVKAIVRMKLPRE